MASPTAGLFGGLATGIFGRMREHEDEQRKMDLEERQGALKSLGSLLEHATPETRPVIYKQMADVMKLKGKHRGVWDMLTGQGRDDYHQQLSQQLDGVFGNVVGPEKYKQLQQEGVKQDLGAAFQANSPYVRSIAPKPTEGKIALRDPIAEHLDALRQQYGLQNDRRSQEIELRNRLTGEREAANDQRDFEFKTRDRDHAAQIAAEKKVRALATTFALQRQSKIPSDEEFARAAEQVAKVEGLNVDKLKAQIGLIGAEERRNDAWAQSLDEGGAGRPMTENQTRVFDANQRKQAADTFKEWTNFRGQVNQLDTQHQGIRKQIADLAAKNGAGFNEAAVYGQSDKPVFYNLKTNDPVDPIELGVTDKSLQSLLGQLRTLYANKNKAYEELKGRHKTLMSDFKGMYNSTNEWDVTPNPEVGGLAPAGAPRTGNPPEWKVAPPSAQTKSPVSGKGEFHDEAGAKPRRLGEIINTGRGQVKIIGIKPGKGMTGGTIYITEAVQ